MRKGIFSLLLLFNSLFAGEELPDQWEFGLLWPQIQRFQEKGLLLPLIRERQEEIAQSLAHWRKKIPRLENGGFKEEMKGTLSPLAGGRGSSYLLRTKKSRSIYIVKPVDEALFCLNHPYHCASPFKDPLIRPKEDVPLYRSAQREALAYQVARLLGLAALTPETHLALLSDEHFFSIDERKKPTKNKKEKLCSVQLFQEGLIPLPDLAREWIAEGKSEEELLPLIRQGEVERLCLLIWILYDVDAHGHNICAYGPPPYRLMKIDNGLTFPEKNRSLLNGAALLPQAKLPLSEEGRERILHLPVKAIGEKIGLYECDEALGAYYERVKALQLLAQMETLSLQEIDQKLTLLCRPKRE